MPTDAQNYLDVSSQKVNFFKDQIVHNVTFDGENFYGKIALVTRSTLLTISLEICKLKNSDHTVVDLALK